MRIVTGIQPTGELHLGNYIGAIKPLIDLQNKADESDRLFVFIADLHTLSAKISPQSLRSGTLNMGAALLACGLNPQRTVLFRQSRVPAHAEMSVLLNGIARMGQLERMTQFKDKSTGIGENSEGPRLALFTYPVLQAADILLYSATHVPVGEDQTQHIQLVREIARKFNHDYARREPVFTIPNAMIPPQGARVMSLQDGTSKMSKSDPSEKSRITILDDHKMIALKIQKAKSDPDVLPKTIDDLSDRPEARNLLTIHAALSGQAMDETVSNYQGRMFSNLKKDLAELTSKEFGPITEKYREYAANPDLIEQCFAQGEEVAIQEARPILEKTYEALGMR